MSDNKNLLNWSEVSKRLSGSDNSIRKNSVPKIYQNKVNRLMRSVDTWVRGLEKEKQ